MRKGVGVTVAVALTAIVGTGSTNAADKIKLGFFSTLEGTYTTLGEDGQRGFDLAVMQHNNKAGGKELEIVRGSSDASPDSALRAAKKLVEQDKVEILIAPLSGSEGIAFRDYAKTQPQVTFINGCSGAQETTYVTPAPNLLPLQHGRRPDAVGLGDYIYNVKHYKKIATIGEDYSFTYTQVFGLALDYCQAGGQITKRLWVPLGTKDFASYHSANAAGGRRRDLSRPRWRRRRELPQPIPAGGRQREAHRRHDYGRSVHLIDEGQGERSPSRRRRRRPPGRHLGTIRNGRRS